MLKLVIADDEKMICSLISRLLDWNELGYEIVGMAYTGVDALDIITREKPDVIISDIRMPGYDGLELIKKTKESGLDPEFIMISGFKQFEYAQNAMKYGVKYYLLKPVEEDKLLEIAKEIRTNVLNKRKHAIYENQLELEIKETRDKMKKRFLTSMLFDENKNEKTGDWDSVNQEYNTSFTEGAFRAIFMKVDTEEEEIHSIIHEIEKFSRVLGEVCEEYITTDTHSGTITLFNYQVEREEAIQKKLEELYEQVKKYVDKFQGFSVVMGVGKRTNSFLNSSVCLKTATDAVKYRIRINHTGIIYWEQHHFDAYDIEKIVTVSRKKNYLAKIAAEDMEGANECLTGTIREVRYGNDNFSPVLLFDIVAIYADLLVNYCKEQNFFNNKIEKSFKHWNIKADNSKNEKALQDATYDFIKETLEYIHAEKKELDIKPIRVIKKYIEAHYMEEINLNQLAELVDMNASYLSSVFKKETGMAYSEYLTHCRIEQASRLLVETNMSISEIAEQSGYQDSRYFSKQFSKQIGLKPSEYRKLYS